MMSVAPDGSPVRMAPVARRISATKSSFMVLTFPAAPAAAARRPQQWRSPSYWMVYGWERVRVQERAVIRVGRLPSTTPSHPT
jgi:hypothetical protein